MQNFSKFGLSTLFLLLFENHSRQFYPKPDFVAKIPFASHLAAVGMMSPGIAYTQLRGFKPLQLCEVHCQSLARNLLFLTCKAIKLGGGGGGGGEKTL